MARLDIELPGKTITYVKIQEFPDVTEIQEIHFSDGTMLILRGDYDGEVEGWLKPIRKTNNAKKG